MAMAYAYDPAFIGVPTDLVARSTGVTVPSPSVTMYAVRPSGVIAIAVGRSPAVMGFPVARCPMSMGVPGLLVVRSMGTTAGPCVSTYAAVPAGVTAMAPGFPSMRMRGPWRWVPMLSGMIPPGPLM